MRFLVLLFLFAGAGCSGDPAGPARAAAPQPGSFEQITSLIGTPTCTANDQCRTIAVGARACGGPQGYLAWSTARTAEPELRALAERYKAERQAQIAAKGEISDCRFIPDPGAVCRQGVCQTGTALPAR